MTEMKKPKIVHDLIALRQAVAEARREGKSIGLVPTMGALHPGHVSLVGESAGRCGFTIVTVFVNPTQFGPKEDFSKYPRTLENDVALVAAQGADLIFAPPVEVVYPPGHNTFVEMHGITEPLEGECRPGHFRGVATVVLKLFNMTQPDVAFFGRKDFQQCLVIKQLVRDFDLPIEIRICPTVREADGLAMSSRNVYLSAEERKQALALSRALKKAEQAVAAGERDAWKIRDVLQTELAASPGVRVQYAVVADAETLREPTVIERPCVALIAAFLGKTRLIDNCLLDAAKLTA